MAKNKVILEDNLGNEVIPVTDTDSVFMMDYNTKLTDKLKNFDSSLETKAKQIEVIQKENLKSFLNDCVVTFIDDDAQLSTINILKPLMDGKGVKFSTCVVGNTVGQNGTMSLTQLKQFEADGNEVLSHSWSKELHTITNEADLCLELQQAQDFMYSNNFKGKDAIVYPTGFSNNETGIFVKQQVRKYFKYGVNAWESVKQPIDSLYIGRVDFNALTLEQLKTKLTEYKKRKDWLVIMIHSWDTAFDSEKLKSFINEINSQSVRILPFTEAIKLKGNMLSCGEYTQGGVTIDSNGRISCNFTKANMGTVMSKIPSDYPNNATFTEVLEYWVTGMPLFPGISPNDSSTSWARYGGILTTYRGLGDDNFTRQVFLQTGALGTMFTRYWSVSSNRWGDWKCVASEHHCGTMNGAYYATMPLTEYPKNSVTHIQILQGTWSLMNGVGGTLTCYRSNDDAYGYQDFVPYNEAKRYKRVWNNGTSTWGSFVAYS